MKKIVSLMLALILVCSLIPMSASAIQIEVIDGKQYVQWEDGGSWVVYEDGKLSGVVDKLPATEEESKPTVEHPHPENPEDHTFGWASDTKYHWKQCACGCKIGMERHVDPKDTEDDYCICGYHFSDNAELVTLWIDGCPPIKDFDKKKTEYELKAYTYKDVKEIKISTKTFDSQATVELPEDLTLKEGTNTFEVTVTAENQKAIKTYAVTVIKHF